MSTEFYNRNWRMPNSWNGSTDNNNKVSNYSMSFDGSSEYIDCGNDSSLSFGTGNFSISCWFKTTQNVLGAADLVINGAFGGGAKNYALLLNNSEKLLFAIDDGNDNPFVISTSSVADGNWHHVVGVRDSVNINLYLDGSLIDSTTDTTDTSIDSTSPLLIGAGTTVNTGVIGNFFEGSLDHVAIFDYALSASQITTLYGNSSTGVGNPMSISPKPIAYYPIGDYAAFNGSEYLVNNGALQDYVFDFVSNDNINCGDSDDFSFGNSANDSPFSFSAWINGDAFGSLAQTIMAKDNSTGREYTFGIWNPAKLRIILHDGAAQQKIETGSNSFDANKWYHTMVTYDGRGGASAADGLKIYINAINQTVTDISSGGTYTAMENTSTPLTIGEYYNSSFFDGKLSNVQIFSTTLPATGSNSVETLYNNGVPLSTMSGFTSLVGWWKLDASATFDGSNWSIPDDSSNSNTGTSSGMTAANLVQSNLLITQPYSRYALSFDGTNDKIELPYNAKLNSGADGYTISSWVNISSTSGNKTIYSTEYNEGIIFLIAGDDIKFYQALTGPSWKSFTVNSSFALSSNTWYNIVATWDGSDNIKIYLNGSLIHTESEFTSLQNPTTPSQFPKIGDYNNLWFMNGSISNVSMWNTSLNQTQVTEIYNQGKPSNLNNHSAYSNLVSWWQLGENMSYDSNVWTVLDEKGTNNGTGANLAPAEDSIVNGVGTSGNGLSDGMGGADNIIGDAPYSTENAVSYGMGVDARVSGSGNVPS